MRPDLVMKAPSGKREVATHSCGKVSLNLKTYGVGFAVKTSLLKATPVILFGVSERLTKLLTPLNKSRNLAIINVYAPTLTNPEEAKEQFCEDLDQSIRKILASDKLILLGDSVPG